MTLFDTAEIVDRPGHTPPNLFSGDKAVLVVYSIDESDSFDSLPSWIDTFFSWASDAVIGLVSNKIDLEYKREVSKARAKELAELYEIPSDLIFEVSALDDTNIQTMFDVIATKIQPAAKKSTEKATKPPSNRSRSIC